ncbi:MAG: response regulator transcription factor [Acidimicrobiales bacterium]
MTSIVVVEDEPDIGDLLALYLRREGWQVHLAGTGEDGQAAIRARQPDFVILDVGLPGALDGFDVCRQLRRSSDVPVLFLTARDDEIDRRAARRNGAVVGLAAQEFALLEVLVRNRGVVMSRQQLLDQAWAEEWIGDPRTVDVHMRQLRR